MAMSDNGTSNAYPQNAGTDQTAEKAIPCDYVDVVRLSGDQPRFLLQPHLAGGAVAMAGFTLEAEGARGLVQHLKAALLEPDAT
jgi:hypothetical protein